MIDIVGDIQNMTTIDAGTFDTVYSSQVLEHVPDPLKALQEIYRVLVPGGHAIVSVPLFNGLHEEPHDYFRYTPYGLKYLMEKAGFKIADQYTAGGLLSFLSHTFSIVFVCSFWRIPVLRWVVWWLNKLLLVHPVLWFEAMAGVSRKFPSTIIMVGKKA
jgi:SAM-dependent methyltransferase